MLENSLSIFGKKKCTMLKKWNDTVKCFQLGNFWNTNRFSFRAFKSMANFEAFLLEHLADHNFVSLVWFIYILCLCISFKKNLFIYKTYQTGKSFYIFCLKFANDDSFLHLSTSIWFLSSARLKLYENKIQELINS